MLRRRRIWHLFPTLIGIVGSLVLSLQLPALAAEPTYSIDRASAGLYTYPGNGHDLPFDDEADGVVGDGRGHVGPIQLSNGSTAVTAYCLDLNHGLAEQYSSDPQQVVDGTTERQRVEVAYIIAKWGSTNDDVRAAAVQIAIWKLFAPEHFADGVSNVASATELTERMYDTIASAEGYVDATGTRLRIFAEQMLDAAHELAVTDPQASVEWKTTTDGGTKFRVEVTGRDANQGIATLSAKQASGTVELEGATFVDAGKRRTVTNGTWYDVETGTTNGASLQGELVLPYRHTIDVLYAKTENKPKQRLIPFGSVNEQALPFADSLPAFSVPSPTPSGASAEASTASSEPSLPSDVEPVSPSAVPSVDESETSDEEVAAQGDDPAAPREVVGTDRSHGALAHTGMSEPLEAVGVAGIAAALGGMALGIARLVRSRRVNREQ